MGTNQPERPDYPLPDGCHYEPIQDPDWRLRHYDPRRAEPHMVGGWAGTCPREGCGVVLQGRDATVVQLHLDAVHNGAFVLGGADDDTACDSCGRHGWPKVDSERPPADLMEYPMRVCADRTACVARVKADAAEMRTPKGRRNV